MLGCVCVCVCIGGLSAWGTVWRYSLEASAGCRACQSALSVRSGHSSGAPLLPCAEAVALLRMCTEMGLLRSLKGSPSPRLRSRDC